MIAQRCFQHAATDGDLSLCMYDVTRLYFEAEHEDALRKVGFSKERRVDPQVVVGLLVDRHGFPLEIGCFEGNKAEKLTIVPIVAQFIDRHSLADLVVVADTGMLSAANLKALDEANVRFIVGSSTTNAPIDLESHFRWHGDAFNDGSKPSLRSVAWLQGHRHHHPEVRTPPAPSSGTRCWIAPI